MTIQYLDQKEKPCVGSECNSVRHISINDFVILIKGVYRESLLDNPKYVNGMRFTASIMWKKYDKYDRFLVEKLATVYASTYKKAVRKLFRGAREHLYAIAVLTGDERGQHHHIDRVNKERRHQGIPILVENTMTLVGERCGKS